MPSSLESDRELWNPAAQGMDPDELARLQRGSLERQWKRIWEQPITFYKNKFESFGLSADEMPPLDEIPFTFKDELRADDAANPPWGTWRAMDLEQATCIGASTGTTGKPLVYLRSEEDYERHIEVVRRNLWREGMRPYSRLTQSWPGGIYAAMGGSLAALRAFPAMEIPVGPPTSIEVAKEHIAMWQMLKPTNFMMTGPQLQIYAQAADEMGVDLREIFNGGGVAFMEAACQFDGPRQKLEERFNFKIYNIGGASELATAAATDCRFHTGLHTHADLAIAQVCDPVSGREVPEGARGHLVWSSTGGTSFWLRYNVEDWVERMPGPCSCGETGLRYRMLGRASDMQIIDGRQLFPLDVQLALDPFGAPEFVIEKDKAPGTLSIKLEIDDDAGRYLAALQQNLAVKVEITKVPIGSLPRSSFKPKRA